MQADLGSLPLKKGDLPWKKEEVADLLLSEQEVREELWFGLAFLKIFSVVHLSMF